MKTYNDEDVTKFRQNWLKRNNKTCLINLTTKETFNYNKEKAVFFKNKIYYPEVQIPY